VQTSHEDTPRPVYLSTFIAINKRLLRVKWSDRIRNESSLDELSAQRQMLAETDKCRAEICWSCKQKTHRQDLIMTALQRTTEDERKKGRPPISYIANITEIRGLGGLQTIVELSRDRKEKWRILMALRGTPTDDRGDRDS